MSVLRLLNLVASNLLCNHFNVLMCTIRLNQGSNRIALKNSQHGRQDGMATMVIFSFIYFYFFMVSIDIISSDELSVPYHTIGA